MITTAQQRAAVAIIAWISSSSWQYVTSYQNQNSRRWSSKTAWRPSGTLGTPGCSSETIVGNNKTETATETETETEMIEGAVRADSVWCARRA